MKRLLLALWALAAASAGADTLPKGFVDLTTWAGTSANLFLGATNPNGGSIDTSLLAPIRIYSCKISEDGTPKRDLVPAQRKFDGKNGLYDNVTGEFYAYYGTRTDFTAFIPPPGTVIFVR